MPCTPTSGADQTLPGTSHASARSSPPVACEAVTEEVRAHGLAELTSLQQRIDRAKRALWALTSAARREPARIEAMVAEISQLERAQQELFVRNIEALMAARCAACRAGSQP
jgi:hypothetical protein